MKYMGRSLQHKTIGSGGIRTHAPEETGALNQRLRPLGHATGRSAAFLSQMRYLHVQRKMDRMHAHA